MVGVRLRLVSAPVACACACGGVRRAQGHPFLVGLVATGRDRDNLYMLLELCQGGDLYQLLDDHGERRTLPRSKACHALC